MSNWSCGFWKSAAVWIGSWISCCPNRESVSSGRSSRSHKWSLQPDLGRRARRIGRFLSPNKIFDFERFGLSLGRHDVWGKLWMHVSPSKIRISRSWLQHCTAALQWSWLLVYLSIDFTWNPEKSSGQSGGQKGPCGSAWPTNEISQWCICYATKVLRRDCYNKKLAVGAISIAAIIAHSTSTGRSRFELSKYFQLLWQKLLHTIMSFIYMSRLLQVPRVLNSYYFFESEGEIKTKIIKVIFLNFESLDFFQRAHSNGFHRIESNSPVGTEFNFLRWPRQS